MFEEERKIQIMNILNRDKRASINDLSAFFQVSSSTIRRDLTAMEKAGLVKRTHGGAILQEQAVADYDFDRKTATNYHLKLAIGKLAATLVRDKDIIAVNSSTITTQMVKHLSARNITLVTNSLNILNLVKDRQDYQVIVLGGIYMNTAQTIEGPTTTEQISQMHFDKAFLGANGVDLHFGLSSASELEARSKIAMIKQSKQSFFLCEHTKFDRSSLLKVAELEEVNAIVTDWQINPETLVRYRAKTEILLAEELAG